MAPLTVIGFFFCFAVAIAAAGLAYWKKGPLAALLIGAGTLVLTSGVFIGILVLLLANSNM
jgi:hypothetical protein